jgi:hypothetical protein
VRKYKIKIWKEMVKVLYCYVKYEFIHIYKKMYRGVHCRSRRECVANIEKLRLDGMEEDMTLGLLFTSLSETKVRAMGPQKKT